MLNYIAAASESNSETQKLPAIKLKLDRSVARTYSNPVRYTNEIHTHKQINRDKIKFISIKEDTLIIATDDPETHKVLSAPWPLSAFEGKMMLLQKQPNPSPSKGPKRPTKNPLILYLSGIHPEIDINDENLQLLLTINNLQNPSRVQNRLDQPTKTIQVEANSPDALKNALKATLSLYHNIIKVTKPPEPIKQCFKCQLKGHTMHTCKNGTRCLRCGGQHRYKTNGQVTCPPNTPTKCINCGDSHSACSRWCRYLNEEAFPTINPELRRKNLSYSQITCQQPRIDQAKLEETVKTIIQEEVKNSLDAPLKSLQDETQKAIKSLKELTDNIEITKIIKTHLDERLKPILDERFAQLAEFITGKITEKINPIYLKDQPLKEKSNSTMPKNHSTTPKTPVQAFRTQEQSQGLV